MELYKIYHATSEARFSEVLEQDRKLVGTVEANCLEDAYQASQNIGHNWNELSPCRSSSIGDAIQSPEGNVYVVMGMGFECIHQDDREPQHEYPQ